MITLNALGRYVKHNISSLNRINSVKKYGRGRLRAALSCDPGKRDWSNKMLAVITFVCK